MYVSILMVSFLLLLLLLAATHYAESFDLKTDNTLVGGTVTGDQVVTGKLTANSLVANNGPIVANNGLNVGNGQLVANGQIISNREIVAKNGLFVENGPLVANREIFAKNGLNVENGTINTQNVYSANSAKFGPNGTTFKTILSNRNYMDGWNKDRYISFGYTFASTPIVTLNLMTDRSDYSISATLKNTDTNGFWYRVWFAAGNNIFAAGDPHYVNWTAIGT